MRTGQHGWVAAHRDRCLSTLMHAAVHRPSPGSEYLTPEGCWILESWNTAVDPDVSMARARVAPGVTTQLHRLHGVAERYLIASGTGTTPTFGSMVQKG